MTISGLIGNACINKLSVRSKVIAGDELTYLEKICAYECSGSPNCNQPCYTPLYQLSKKSRETILEEHFHIT